MPMAMRMTSAETVVIAAAIVRACLSVKLSAILQLPADQILVKSYTKLVRVELASGYTGVSTETA